MKPNHRAIEVDATEDASIPIKNFARLLWRIPEMAGWVVQTPF
jgi:hypothetical protein